VAGFANINEAPYYEIPKQEREAPKVNFK